MTNAAHDGQVTTPVRGRSGGTTPGRPYAQDALRPYAVLVAVGVLAVISASVLLHGLTADPAAASSWLAAAVLLALLAAWQRARVACGQARRELDEVCARVDETERLLGEDEDTLHEVRTALAGLVLSDRLLTEHEDLLDDATRERLLHLRGRDLDRIQHLLAGGLHHVAPPTDLEPDEFDGDDGFEVVDAAATAYEDVAVGPLVSDAVTAAHLRGEPVHRTTPDAPGQTVRADPLDIAEVLDILLRNAARHAPGARVEIEVHRAGSRVVLRVRDQGPGVPAGLRSTLFTRGARGPSSPGSGLGLAMARRLTDRNDGDLVLEESTSRGTVFALVLPAADADTSTITPLSTETTMPTTTTTTERLAAVLSCHAHSA